MRLSSAFSIEILSQSGPGMDRVVFAPRFKKRCNEYSIGTHRSAKGTVLLATVGCVTSQLPIFRELL